MAEINPESRFTPADWQSLNPLLERCYIGPPAGRSGTFPGTVFTIAKLLQGSVHMQKGRQSIKVAARDKVWILCTPGTRTQHFSDDSEIISIHIAPGNPQNGAEWTGPALVSAEAGEEAEAALSDLAHSTALDEIAPQQRLSLHAMEMPITSYLQLKQQTLKVFMHALILAGQHGMRYEVPAIQDLRVRSSHRQLAAMDIRDPLSRQALAAQEGLTAGQLDRLWRAELGLTTTQYHDCQRLTYACGQLRRHDIPIKVIAAELGFRHLSQFSNWFHSRHGESPRSFRKRPGTS